MYILFSILIWLAFSINLLISRDVIGKLRSELDEMRDERDESRWVAMENGHEI